VAVKAHLVEIADAEGVISGYCFKARSRRRAERDAREWAQRQDWGATFVGIASGEERTWVGGRRLLAVAGVTVAVWGLTIATVLIIGLRLEGAL